MKLRRFLFAVVPLALVLTACSDPVSSRFPDSEEDSDPPDQTNQLIVSSDSVNLD